LVPSGVKSMGGFPRIQFPCGGCRLGRSFFYGMTNGLVANGWRFWQTIPGAGWRSGCSSVFKRTSNSQSAPTTSGHGRSAWAAYSLQYGLILGCYCAGRPPRLFLLFRNSCIFGMAFCVFLSTRLTRREFRRWLWYYGVLGGRRQRRILDPPSADGWRDPHAPGRAVRR